jgi:hypothetical protein
MTTKNVTTAKEKVSQKESQAPSKEAIVSVNELAKKLNILPKRLRSFLRVEYPRDNKGKKWELTTPLAGKIEKDYKAKIKAKDETKKEEPKTIKEHLPKKETIEINSEIKQENKNIEPGK